eukprot:gnl/TRDRNA2_/TRDRNA2_94358_c1_seq1.p1 gnl/TRDRNA2_/TRDRNA2_94358_c1~~gnl/TRDRNA2_/TRDRNA2_94358_c1_seq1.p1  ORF type:complete len:367 (+),score=52.97 gnl/TRDRNA2_/TRDRNA2_94358_c1_seq1:23-1102(+)
MSSAERLALFPRYFELSAEPGVRESMHSVQTRSIASSQDVPQSQNAPAAADVKYVEEVQVDGVERADSKVTEQSAASSVPSSSPSPPTPPSPRHSENLHSEQALDTRMAAEAASTKPAERKRPRLSDKEIRDRELAWIRKDVERFAPRATHNRVSPAAARDSQEGPVTRGTQRGKPQSAQEWKRRELEWLRRDVELHSPRQLHRASVEEQLSPLSTSSSRITPPRQHPTSSRSSAGSVSSSHRGLPFSIEEYEKREASWIEVEVARLLKAAAISQTDVGHQGSCAGSKCSMVGEAPLQRAGQSKVFARSRQKPTTASEWEQREKEWIHGDVEMHVPRNHTSIRKCQDGKAKAALLIEPV